MENENIAQDEPKQEKIETVKKEDKPVPRAGSLFARIWGWVIFVLFALAFFMLYIGGQSGLNAEIRDIGNSEMIGIFSTWSPYAGIILALLSLVVYMLLLGIKRLARLKKLTCLNPVLLAISFLPWFLLARQLVYFEPRYTDIAKALISFIGEPLYDATVFVFILSALWLILLITVRFAGKPSKTAALVILLAASPLFLSGCVGALMGIVCDFMPEADHCFQGAAVQEGDPSGCDKVEGEGFTGSNPPRDKCYLMIAENTGDLSACDNIEGGPMSYTREECILGAAVKFEDAAGCRMLTGTDKSECIAQVGPKMEPGSVIEIDDQIALLREELKKGADPDLEKQLQGLTQKRTDILDIMSDTNRQNYESMSDPLNRAASLDYHLGKIDAKTRDTLVELNDRLRARGESMNETDYQKLRDVLAYKNDPKNDIENMDEREMLKKRWNEKLGSAVDYLKFWNANPTATEQKYDEQLFMYERMLERQAAIDKGLSERQQDIDRNLGMVKDALKDKAWSTATDEAKKAAFGELMDLVDSSAEAPVTAVLGEAIDTVKKEAKSAEFRGLVRAYNLGMEEELAKAGGNIERAHEIVTANLQKDPYMYEDKNSFAKYGNVLENKDCDGTNPHCINRDVFWKAMKKSYKYQNQV